MARPTSPEDLAADLLAEERAAWDAFVRSAFDSLVRSGSEYGSVNLTTLVERATHAASVVAIERRRFADEQKKTR